MMAVQLTIPYETLLTLVEQLPAEKQRDLLHRLEVKVRQSKLTKAQWTALFESIIIHTPISEEFSFNREDWYDDEVL